MRTAKDQSGIYTIETLNENPDTVATFRAVKKKGNYEITFGKKTAYAGNNFFVNILKSNSEQRAAQDVNTIVRRLGIEDLFKQDGKIWKGQFKVSRKELSNIPLENSTATPEAGLQEQGEKGVVSKPSTIPDESETSNRGSQLTQTSTNQNSSGHSSNNTPEHTKKGGSTNSTSSRESGNFSNKIEIPFEPVTWALLPLYPSKTKQNDKQVENQTGGENPKDNYDLYVRKVMDIAEQETYNTYVTGLIKKYQEIFEKLYNSSKAIEITFCEEVARIQGKLSGIKTEDNKLSIYDDDLTRRDFLNDFFGIKEKSATGGTETFVLSGTEFYRQVREAVFKRLNQDGVLAYSTQKDAGLYKNTNATRTYFIPLPNKLERNFQDKEELMEAFAKLIVGDILTSFFAETDKALDEEWIKNNPVGKDFETKNGGLITGQMVVADIAGTNDSDSKKQKPSKDLLRSEGSQKPGGSQLRLLSQKEINKINKKTKEYVKAVGGSIIGNAVEQLLLAHFSQLKIGGKNLEPVLSADVTKDTYNMSGQKFTSSQKTDIFIPIDIPNPDSKMEFQGEVRFSVKAASSNPKFAESASLSKRIMDFYSATKANNEVQLGINMGNLILNSLIGNTYFSKNKKVTSQAYQLIGLMSATLLFDDFGIEKTKEGKQILNFVSYNGETEPASIIYKGFSNGIDRITKYHLSIKDSSQSIQKPKAAATKIVKNLQDEIPDSFAGEEKKLQAWAEMSNESAKKVADLWMLQTFKFQRSLIARALKS